MRRLTTILILTFVRITCWGQATDQKENGDRLQFVFDSNLPDDLYDFYNQEKIRTSYKINRDLNPFYLRGDFNGDKKVDYALAVIESKTNKKGIMIYHPATKQYFLAGAGKSIPYGHGDDYSMLDGWEVSDEKIVEQGVRIKATQVSWRSYSCSKIRVLKRTNLLGRKRIQVVSTRRLSKRTTSTSNTFVLL